MAKRGPKAGWAQQLRDDLEFQKVRNQRLLEYNKELADRAHRFNALTFCQKLLFIIRGRWV